MSKSKAATETMIIAFSHGGILPSEITGGEERHVDAHEPVSVPVAYGRHLVADRFAYEPKDKPADGLTKDKRKAIEKKIEGLRDDLKKATTDEAKAKLTTEIGELEKQLG